MYLIITISKGITFGGGDMLYLGDSARKTWAHCCCWNKGPRAGCDINYQRLVASRKSEQVVQSVIVMACMPANRDGKKEYWFCGLSYQCKRRHIVAVGVSAGCCLHGCVPNLQHMAANHY